MKKFITLSLGLFIILAVFGYAKWKKEKVLGIRDEESREIYGIILPHHELASSIIIDSLEKISKDNDYESIVILGPNHFYPESPMVMTSLKLKDYLVDQKLVSSLIDENFADEEEKILDGEHSVGVPIKYLSNYFPNALLVPLLISPHYNEESINKIVDILFSQDSKKTLFVLSCDFSHNLSLDESLKNNEETIKTLISFDYPTLLTYDDRHLDSPVAAYIFLNIMEKMEAKNWQLHYSSHGAMFENVADLNGTSYVIGTFSR